MDKTREKQYLNSFLKTAGYNFTEIICREKPDFTLINSDSVVGIELTEFNNDDKSHIIRSVMHTLDLIKNELNDELNQITKENISLTFTPRKPIKKRINRNDREKVKQFLLNHIKKNDVLRDCDKDSYYQEFEYDELACEFIENVIVAKISKAGGPCTIMTDYYVVGDIKPDDIQKVIDKKETLIDLSEHPENWLLIVIAEAEFSDGAYLNESTDSVFFSKFDKIFVYTRLSKSIFSLTLANR